MSWIVLRNTGPVFCRMPLSWGLPNVFLVLEEVCHSGAFLITYQQPEDTYYQHDLYLAMLTLITWFNKLISKYMYGNTKYLAETISKNKSKAEGFTLPVFKPDFKAIVIKIVQNWHKDKSL